MGRNRLSNAELQARGNPGKRPLPNEAPIPVADVRCPYGLPKEQKKYWKLWAPHVVAMGRLTVINMPAFLNMLDAQVILDHLLRGLTRGLAAPGTDGAMPLMQEKKNYHGETVDIGPSTADKQARAWASTVRQLQADFGIRADKMGGLYRPEPKKTEEEEFLGD